MTRVPFTDLAAMTGEVWPEIEQDYLSCLLDGAYIGGPAVTAFERGWAAYCGADHAVGVANGTDALQLSLTALGVGPGDEVVVPANTFIATAAAVVRAGATPALRRRQRRHAAHDGGHPRRGDHAAHPGGHRRPSVRTAAGYGRPCRHRSAGGNSRHRRRRAGARRGMGRPSRGIVRRGGVLQLLSREEPGRLRRRWRRVNLAAGTGRSRYGPWPTTAGPMVTRTTTTTASARTAAWTPSRRSCSPESLPTSRSGQNAGSRWLRATGSSSAADEFTGTGLKLTATAPSARHVYHLFVVRVARRDSVRAALTRRGIQTGVHYPVPCHRQPPLRRFAERPLPVAERAAGEVLSLPLFPHMTDRQVDYVCESLAEALRAAAVGSEAASAQ